MRFMVATDLFTEQIVGGGTSLGPYALADLAVSAVTLAWILADVELDADLPPTERSKWRTNITNFRKKLVQSGGSVPAVSHDALEKWGKALLLHLSHNDGTETYEMSSEERLVIATAWELGLIYLTPPRDWNATLRDDFGLAVQEL